MRLAVSKRGMGTARWGLSSGTQRQRSPLCRMRTSPQRSVAIRKSVSAVKSFPMTNLQFSRVWARAGDEERDPHEGADLGSFFDDDEEQDTEEAELDEEEEEEEMDEEEADLESEPTSMSPDDSTDESADAESEDAETKEEEEYDDIAHKDRLAYERLIIEGADVENVEEEMLNMDETLTSIQETYLDGSAYDSAFEAPQMPIKKLEDFPYKPMPEFSMQLLDLLNQARLDEEAQLVLERWEDVTITGLHSRAENVTSGSIYFAQSSDVYDGEKNISLAVDNGAVAILVQDNVEISSQEEPNLEFGNGANAGMNLNEPVERVTRCADREKWKQLLREKGIPIDDLEILLPVLPVLNLPYAMSSMGCVFYGFPSSKMKVTGIVGSHGKTSTSWILRQILEEFKVCTGMMCDIEYAILGDQLTAEGELFIPKENDPAHFRLAATPYHLTPFKGRYYIDGAVPDPLQVQKILAGMAYRGARACIVECSVEALADCRLQNVDFDVLVYTNLESEGMDTEETFAQKKLVSAELFGKMDIPEGQRAVINIDDPHAQEFIDRSSEVPVVTYSLSNVAADVSTESVSYNIWESEIVIRTPLGKMQIITPLIGKHNVYNILASVAAAISIDVDLPTVVTGIELLDYIPGRYEVVDEGQDFSVVVDSADSAPRLKSLIQNLRACAARRVFLVFGCCGYHSQQERALMGSVAHYNADVVIITSDSPAGQAPDEIIDDIVAGFPEDVLKRSELWVLSPWQDPGRVPWWFEEWLFRAQKEVQRHIIEDRSIAIRGAIGTARKNDVVVVAGRGHKDFAWWSDKDDQLFKAWYEDRKEVRDALIKLPHLRKSQVITDRLPWTEPEETQDARVSL